MRKQVGYKAEFACLELNMGSLRLRMDLPYPIVVPSLAISAPGPTEVGSIQTYSLSVSGYGSRGITTAIQYIITVSKRNGECIEITQDALHLHHFNYSLHVLLLIKIQQIKDAWLETLYGVAMHRVFYL